MSSTRDVARGHAGRREDGGQRKADLIADELRKEIASGVLAPDTRLQQSQLAVRFATSITPVREALQRLEAEGLLEGAPHRGVRVASPNLEQIMSVYLMRRLLEPMAARRAATRLTRRDFDEARAINQALGQATAAGLELDRGRLNHQLHFMFYRACGLPTLLAEIERLWASFPWASLQVRKNRKPDSILDHEEMLAAVEANDQDGIQLQFESHIDHGYAALMEELGFVTEGNVFEMDRSSVRPAELPTTWTTTSPDR